MTVAEFLNKCRLDETKLRITSRGKGRVYDGTVKDFKIGEEYAEEKNRLAKSEIYIIGFDGMVSIYNQDASSGVHFEPVVIIVI